MKFKMIRLAMIASAILAACGAPSTPAAPPTKPPVPTSKPSAPTSTPFVSPLESPLLSPIETPPVPGSGLISKPSAEQWATAPQAALSARQALVEQLKIDPDTIKLVSVEQVDWPDACLGVQKPGVMCAQVITSGYRVVMEAQGNLYEFHTDETGSAVKFQAQSVP
jgi:hypothetical protein